MLQISAKVVLLGESAVGKTSLIRRYTHNEFDEKTIQSTSKVHWLQKNIRIDLDRVALRIWDTGGQERYHSLQPMYYRGAKGALLVYAINDYQSYERVKKWVVELKKFEPDVIISIVGAKCDLTQERQVKGDEVDKYCASIKVKHFITSAKANKNVTDCFLDIVKRILSKEKIKQANSSGSQKRQMFSSSGGYQSSGYSGGYGSKMERKGLLVGDEDDDNDFGRRDSKCYCC